MEAWTRKQFLALVVAVAIGSSALTAAATYGLVTGERPADIVARLADTAQNVLAQDQEQAQAHEEAVVAVVARASPAVVSIVAAKDVPVVDRFSPFAEDPFFQQFFGITPEDPGQTERQEISAGSGFIVSADGLIITNRHVVADTTADYTVFFNDGSSAPARVLARDEFQDLAVLRVDRENLPILAFGDANAIKPGQTAIAIGNALGEFSNTVSVGVVSGLHRSVFASGGRGEVEELQELIQTDAAINPGNSGGPLLNLRGEVIGVNVAMASGAENIGFAIPSNYARRDVESVRERGRIVYPYLGIRYQLITKELAEERNLPVDQGALLVGGEGSSAVIQGSPAAAAGLVEGDIIVEFDGTAVNLDRPLASLIRERKAGDSVRLAVRRGNDTFTVTVELAERPTP
ncbi:PDZ domain-containing protein [Candidatus Parcubacteria bacterium]|nr:MAG: PDZ domain-containing protein [Candidatus Parcubacteria bacterium]